MTTAIPQTQKGAHFSLDRTHRYMLWRSWDMHKGRVMFVCLNPSTADENADDPTTRRCMGFARDWGYGGIWLVNLFSSRSTDPRELLQVSDPVGPENDMWLRVYGQTAPKVVVAWGVDGALKGRGDQVLALLESLGPVWCFGLTKTGQPLHPLFLPGGMPLMPIREAVALQEEEERR